MTYKAYICGPAVCPNDPAFEHEYGDCVPADLDYFTGRSKTYRSTKQADGLWRWNGGCDAAQTKSRRKEPTTGAPTPAAGSTGPLSRSQTDGNPRCSPPTNPDGPCSSDS